MSSIVTSGDGAACLLEKSLAFFDATGAKTSAIKLPKAAVAVAPFGDEWLLHTPGAKHLTRASADGTLATFADARAKIDTFAVDREDAVAVSRGPSLELWSRDEKKRWSAKGGPFHVVTLTRDHVVALDEAGALLFFDKTSGEGLGALRLASTAAPSSWRLALVDGNVLVLALGDWLVWIDGAIRKTVRRVRARTNVVAVAADAAHVVAAVEDGEDANAGGAQIFHAKSGEPGSWIGDARAARGLALGRGALFWVNDGAVASVARQAFGPTAALVASPVTALGARADLVAAGDKAGNVRVLRAGREDVATVRVGEAVSFVHLARNGAVVAAGERIVVRAPPPYAKTLPIALRAPASAVAVDDAYIFVGGATGAVEVHDLVSGKHVTTYTLSSDDRITSLQRLAGSLLVVGTGALDGRVLFVDVAESKVVHRVSPHEEAFGVTCLAADARGRIVASGSDDGSIALLDPTKGRVLARLRVPETPTSLAFEPSGRSLACVFADGTAALVTFSPKGASLTDLGLRAAARVVWADGWVFGFRDGRVASADPTPRPPSVRPSAG